MTDSTTVILVAIVGAIIGYVIGSGMLGPILSSSSSITTPTYSVSDGYQKVKASISTPSF